MKTVLRIALFIGALIVTGKTLQAQCKVSELLIQNLVPSGPSAPGTCTATFDLSFTQEANNGNKYVFVHVFAETNYPDYFVCVNGLPSANGAIHPPEGPDLVNSFINIGIDNNGATPLLLTSYPPDGTVILNSATSVTSTTLPDGSISFVVHGVLATLPVDCNTPFLMLADIWSSQSDPANVAQCVNCHIEFALNFMSATGFANCSNLTYSINLTNRIGLQLGGYYQVYADADHNGVLSLSADSLIRDTTTFILGAGVGTIYPITGSIPQVNINQDLFLAVRLNAGVGAGSITVFRILSTLCSPLPVTFGTFMVKRISTNTVYLQWQTFTEINNNGFAIERNMGDGIWNTVGFVPTQSANSNSTLDYSFTDPNTNKNITQYRLRQVDIDSRVKYSEVRIVRGNGQTTDLLLYPNPSFNSVVNVIFDDKESIRDIIVSDTYGRSVRHWNNFGGNTLQISDLQAGAYILRVKNRADGAQTTTKFVILGRK
ncbi:MAG TPA: T9SS type A sorting domain-containing protein [Chitinophagaceae bacterium]|nr:T9SS type A sorting domain-containing protein [Chitinophagaceae bacterium]